MLNYDETIQSELPKTLKTKVVHHRDRFKQLFKARYMELLPSLIKYRNSKTVSIDFDKVEIALRNGHDIVIGQTNQGNIQVLGYATSKQTIGNPSNLFSNDSLRHGDIKFVIPSVYQLPYYKEITHQDSCKTGNFVVLRNKNINYITDVDIINHYVDELAEIVLSRFSISMQVKITTLFLGEANDETLNEVISDLYNGNPYIKATKIFDPDSQIYHMKNENIAQNFQELKREYQNKISELNNMLGIQSLAVEKSSGVSDEEARGNRSFTTSNANIHLDGRNNGLKKLNKRFNLELEAIYNDEVASEFSELYRKIEQDEVRGDQSNDNDTI